MKFKITVTVIEGPNKGDHAEMESGEIKIGRGRCHLTLNDKKVSGTHCRVKVDAKGIVWLEDLQSTNGTFVGAHRISQPYRLENLDEFVVGHSRLSVALVDKLESPKVDESQSFSRTEHVPPAPLEIPADDAPYRETGIHRIEGLIEDEMAALSRWDAPTGKLKDGNEQSLPTIRVILKRVKGPDGFKEFVCSKNTNTMGRKNVDLKLNDLDCSRVHAQVEIFGRKAFIKDAGSTNGTLLNGRRITSEELANGDLIQVGQTVMEVKIEGGS